jgi:nucleoid DNA-binding protein
MSEKYTKEFLLRELAVRAKFNVNDVKILWNTFEELVEEMVAEKDELLIGGLFKIYVKEILPHIRYDLNSKKHVDVGTTYRITISPSSTLKNALKRRIKNS